jgi:hypothetical protein
MSKKFLIYQIIFKINFFFFDREEKGNQNQQNNLGYNISNDMFLIPTFNLIGNANNNNNNNNNQLFNQ